MGAKYGSSKVLKEEPGPGSYNIEDNKKSVDDIKTAMASMKIAQGFRQAK